MNQQSKEQKQGRKHLTGKDFSENKWRLHNSNSRRNTTNTKKGLKSVQHTLNDYISQAPEDKTGTAETEMKVLIEQVVKSKQEIGGYKEAGKVTAGLLSRDST